MQEPIDNSLWEVVDITPEELQAHNDSLWDEWNSI